MTGKQQVEKDVAVRCPACDYFVFEPLLIEMEGKTMFKTVCKSCKVKLLVTITQSEIVITPL